MTQNKIVKKLLSFLTGTIIFVVLPMISRGLFDIQTYFDNKERLLYTIIMIIMNILVVILVPNEGKSVGEGEKLIKKHKISLLALQIIPLAIVIISPIFDHHNIFIFKENEWIRIIGIVFVIIGYTIMNWSAYVLDKQFSIDVTIQKKHELITTGPYKSVRHPRYIGIIIFFLGVIGVFNALLSIILILILLGFLLWRIYDEEKIMKNEFKEKRETYTKKTWKLVPYIW